MRYQLLVNDPSGSQSVMMVEQTGGYFDSAQVLWDERADGPLPPITLGGMVRVSGALQFSQQRMESNLPAMKSQLIAQVQALLTEKSQAPIVVGGVTMSPDDRDLVRSLIAKGNSQPQRKKVLKSGQAIIITPAVVDAVLAATDTLVQGCEDRAYNLVAAINAAATVAELPDITTGWPGL